MALDQLHEIERLESEKGEMSFFEHLEELRSTLVWIAAAIGVVMVVLMFNKDLVFNKLLFGPLKADFPTFRVLCWLSQSLGAGETMCFTPMQITMQAIGPAEMLMQHIYLSFWLGLVFTCPFIFYKIWQFISPGLLEHEKSAVRGVVAICSSLFIAGVAFGYFIIAPLSWNFLASYASGIEQVTFQPTVDSITTYMTMFTMPIGLIFEMPVAGYFLAKIGILGKAAMRNYRRYAIVVIVIVAAIITPPDVVSQILVSIPLLFLYEVTISIVGRVEAKRFEAMDAGRAAVDGNDAQKQISK